MILLEVYNKALEELLLSRFELARSDEKLELFDFNIADFDGVMLNIHNKKDDRNRLLVSIALKFYKELEENGANKVLQREYGDLLQAKPEPGFNVTVCVDVGKVIAGDKVEATALARKVALLKRHCFAGVFERLFMSQVNGETANAGRAIIHFRDDETMYIQALADRVTVVFSTVFKDVDDIVIGKVFMQEFTEARRRFDRAPQVLYSHRTPPAELQGTDAATGDNVAYITFVLFPRHIDAAHCAHTIDLVHSLRTYLHYHIKCCKAYVQMRMRAKSADFLKVLNRAQPGNNTNGGGEWGGQGSGSGAASGLAMRSGGSSTANRPVIQLKPTGEVPVIGSPPPVAQRRFSRMA